MGGDNRPGEGPLTLLSNNTVKTGNKDANTYNKIADPKDVQKQVNEIRTHVDAKEIILKNKDQLNAYKSVNYWAKLILTKDAKKEEVESWIANYNWSKLYFDLVTDPLRAESKLRNIAIQDGVEEKDVNSYLSNMKSLSAAVFAVVSRGIDAEKFWAEMDKRNYTGKESGEGLTNKIQNSLYNIGGNELVSEWKNALIAITDAMLNAMNEKPTESPDVLTMMTAFELWRMLDETQKRFGARARDQALAIANEQRDKTGFFT